MKITSLVFVLLLTLGLNAKVYLLSEVDSAPVFAKGKMTSDKFMGYYLDYPQADYDNGVQGTVTLEYTVDQTGMVMDVKVRNSVSASLDEEALRLASLFPFYAPAQKDGENVAVKLFFPVVFRIEGTATPASNSVANVNNNAPKSPLYVVNDKVLQEDENIDPSTIKKIRVVKGQKAIDLYGTRAKDGLILIETK